MREAELETRKKLRPVKTSILTMLGRGTRKYSEINKIKFTVFDCFDGTLIWFFKNVLLLQSFPAKTTSR